jgi:hypothetical protein
MRGKQVENTANLPVCCILKPDKKNRTLTAQRAAEIKRKTITG